MSIPQHAIASKMLDLVKADTTNFSTLTGYIEGIPDVIPMKYRKACICIAVLSDQPGVTQETGRDNREFYGETRIFTVAQQVITFDADLRCVVQPQLDCITYVEAFRQLFMKTANIRLGDLTYTGGVIEWIRFPDTVTYMQDRMGVENDPIYMGRIPFVVRVSENKT